jgi:hypothetical protein
MEGGGHNDEQFYNRIQTKIVELRGKIDTPNAQIHVCSISGFVEILQ